MPVILIISPGLKLAIRVSVSCAVATFTHRRAPKQVRVHEREQRHGREPPEIPALEPARHDPRVEERQPRADQAHERDHDQHQRPREQARDRLQECINFYRQSLPEERRAFMTRHGIRYVYLGSTERRFGALDLDGDPDFQQLYARDGTAIYELKEPRDSRRLTFRSEPGNGSPTAGVER